MFFNKKVSFATLILILGFIFPAFSARNIQCVWQKSVDIMTNPDSTSSVRYKAWHFEPLTVISTKGKWSKVAEHYRKTKKNKKTGEHPKGIKDGWILSENIKRARCLNVRSKVLNVRSGPGTQFKALFQVYRGYPFKYLKRKGEWYQVTDGKDTGWVHRNFVWSPWL